MANGKRAFWIHQLAEYVLGGALIAQGLQSLTPVVPSVAGALVMLNAACAKGGLSAFRLVPKRTHRVLDLVVIGIVVFGAVQPFVSLDAAGRLTMLGVAAVLFVVWRQSDFAEKVPRSAIAAEGGRSTEIGRLAGRAVGDGVNAVKRFKKPSGPDGS
jgi:hypothetical protein